jgi:hypothetical protein
MRTFLDDTLVADNGTADALGQALDVARERAQSLGRVIVEVWADGIRVGDNELTEPPSGPSPYAAELRLVSETPAALVRSALLDAADAAAELRSTQTAAADHLLAGRTIEGVDALREALGLWESIRRVIVDGGAMIGRPLEAEPPIRGLLTELQSRLANLGRLMTAKDWPALADELGYDLSDHAEAWRVGLNALADTLA